MKSWFVGVFLVFLILELAHVADSKVIITTAEAVENDKDQPNHDSNRERGLAGGDGGGLGIGAPGGLVCSRISDATKAKLENFKKMIRIFLTLKGAAIFVSSVHMFNGLGLMLQFVTFPIVYSATTALDKDKGTVIEEIRMFEYLPGLVYSVLYLATGIFIFKGVETESVQMIKLPVLIFLAVQILFFVMRGMVGVFPIPIMMSDLSISEKPSQWNIYKSIQYLSMTILGGAVYLSVLFLYLQQLTGPNSNITDIICISRPKPSKGAAPIECCENMNKDSNLASNMATYSSPLKKSKCQHFNPSSHRKPQEASDQGQGQGQGQGYPQQQQNVNPNQNANVYAQAFERPSARY